MAEKKGPFRPPLFCHWHPQGASKTSKEEPYAEHASYDEFIPAKRGHDLTDHDKLNRYRRNTQGQKADPKPSFPHKKDCWIAGVLEYWTIALLDTIIF